MTELGAHGIAVTLPPGWEGRVFKRPGAGEVGISAADGAPAASGESTNAVVHVATIALPIGVGDFASGAVDQLGSDDALIVLFEHDPASARQALFRATGLPRSVSPDDFSPSVLQRTIRGQAGVQKFFHQQGRAFCLYIVIGSFANRRRVVPVVNQVLATMTIGAATGGGPNASSSGSTPETTTTTTTTQPPTAATEPATTVPPTTQPPTTEPPTTAPPTTAPATTTTTTGAPPAEPTTTTTP